MKLNFIALLLLFFTSAALYSRVDVKFSGFVKTDIIYDTRQTVAAREGHFLLFPQPELPDPNGVDINAEPNFNILSIQSRARAVITGPEVLGAKSSGFLEGAFFGAIDPAINQFRLRHAFVTLDWENSHLKVGQAWHPLFITDCAPAVVSFNTGAPFQPFSRNPQIRFTQDFGRISLSIAAISQRDFTNDGPLGPTSKYLRDAALPEGFLGLRYNSENFLIGAGGTYKILQPRIATVTGYETDETLASMAFEGYSKIEIDPVTVKLEGFYGQNNSNMTMIGGYGVSSFDENTHQEEYTNINVMSFWTDISFGEDVEIGLFAGYTENLGVEEELFPVNVPDPQANPYQTWGRGTNIKNILRFSPRVVLNYDPVRIAGEIEYTSAAFGAVSPELELDETTEVANLRTLIAVFIFF